MNASSKYKNHAGVPHWKRQRLSAQILIPLTLWILYSLIHHIGANYEEAGAWVRQPFIAIMLIVFICALFYHAKLGLQVIIEDYFSDLTARKLTIQISNLLCWLAMLTGIASILKIVING